jgi:hypothetical protein
MVIRPGAAVIEGDGAKLIEIRGEDMKRSVLAGADGHIRR